MNKRDNTPADAPAPTLPGHEFKARVAGEVKYRDGDGPLIELPQGQLIDVAPAIASMAVSWTEGEETRIASLAKEEFERYVQTGDIVLGG